MVSNRRIGAEDSKSRAALLDATERIMLEEGYAAVSSRRVAERADLKPQLVHYYFRTTSSWPRSGGGPRWVSST
jgi:AcrR family transcriptional regulator